MRLLHIADVHLERPFRRLEYRRGHSRRQELRDALSRAVDSARQYDVDALCIAGDLYERENAPPAVGEFLRATFERLGTTPVLIAPGNHDFFAAGCLYDRVDWPPNVHVFRDPRPSPVRVADGTVWGAAFTGPECTGSPLAGLHVSDDGPHVGLFHGQVVSDDQSSAYGPIALSAFASTGLAFAMLGHVHGGRIDEAHGFAYPGSLEPLDVSEVGPRWGLLLTVNASGRSVERITLAHRRVLSDEIDLSTISTVQDLRLEIDRHRTDWEGNDVRLRLYGTLQGELLAHPDSIREALLGLDVDPRLEARPAEDLDALARQQTTLGAFIREARRLAEEAAESDRSHWEDVLAAGIAAFRGQEVILR